MPSTVLMIAAEAREFAGLPARSKPLAWGVEFAREMELNGRRAVLVANGAGMRMAGRGADEAIRHVRPDAVVSTGFCGAVDPAIPTGAVFAASSVLDPDRGERYACASTDVGGCESGTLVSVDRVACTPSEKRQLREATGARVVEMESAAIAERSRLWGIPFYCIRSVTDPASLGFGIDFNQMRDRNGRFSRGRIVWAALRSPRVGIPALIELNRNCSIAAKSLGEFLANCRF